VDEIIVVSNGSNDGTNEWLLTQDVVSVIRDNRGAGPGRNSGLDMASEFDYALMIDGGIRPLIGGTEKMLDYLERHPVTENRFRRVDVVGVDVGHFETNKNKAWRRWPSRIDDAEEKTKYSAYHNRALSLTAYALCRKEVWNGFRFSEDGPFGEPGWGVDDDELACQWQEAKFIVHAVMNVHPYRRASGSFGRLFRETGIWPNQYGSVYEKRLVWMQQNWPQYGRGIQWGEPWLTVVVKVGELEETARIIKQAHDGLRRRTFKEPWHDIPNPYSVVAWNPMEEFAEWAEPRRLRQHHGNTIVVDGKIVKKRNEGIWTGDFRVWKGEDWKESVRPNAYYYALVSSKEELEKMLLRYDEVYPRQEGNVPPEAREEIG